MAVHSCVAVIQSLQREDGGPSSLGLLTLPISLPFLVFCSFSISNPSAAHYSLHLTVKLSGGMKFPIIGDSPAERAPRSSSSLPAPKTGANQFHLRFGRRRSSSSASFSYSGLRCTRPLLRFSAPIFAKFPDVSTPLITQGSGLHHLVTVHPI